ncbi:cytochrome o ubiquinol oxidase subunit III [Carnimonas nigrificans]|uniref:cytochrome o ubiquinol oxidase subunit III n=1 Tax=Carnimonas nigrificans TaxID=64323 RepID=UPI00046FB589|nr:cytochrome o ubiquinol oxidase subunit III [Carnimonas nigrificans]
MTTQTIQHNDAHASGHEHHDTISLRVFGFWIYIMSDCILFSALFATYAVIGHNFAGGPSGHDIFELPFVLVETFVLLASSFMIGLAMLAVHRGDKNKTLIWLFLTLILGAVFVGLEVYEFHHLIAEGFGPQRSGFLSSYFGLVGTHGLHVTSGVIWGLILLFQIGSKGLTENNISRISCLSLFWHFLHIVWICVFTIVYLAGVL